MDKTSKKSFKLLDKFFKENSLEQIKEIVNTIPNHDKVSRKTKKLIRFEINEILSKNNFSKGELLYILEMLRTI